MIIIKYVSAKNPMPETRRDKYGGINCFNYENIVAFPKNQRFLLTLNFKLSYKKKKKMTTDF